MIDSQGKEFNPYSPPKSCDPHLSDNNKRSNLIATLTDFVFGLLALFIENTFRLGQKTSLHLTKVFSQKPGPSVKNDCEELSIEQDVCAYWYCGIDCSSSMRRHAKIFPHAWNNELVLKINRTYSNLRVRLFKVSNEVTSDSDNFDNASILPQFKEEDIQLDRLLRRGSSFYKYLTIASQNAIDFIDSKSLDVDKTPLLVTLLCDGEPTDYSTHGKQAIELVSQAKARGVKFIIACFVPDRQKILTRMEEFRLTLDFRDHGSSEEIEFIVVRPKLEDDEDMSSVAAIETLFEGIHANVTFRNRRY